MDTSVLQCIKIYLIYGMFRENSMYIIYSETDHQPRWDAWEKCSDQMQWEDPEESGGEGGGRGDRDGEYIVNPWLIHVSVWQNPLQCCEVISLQLIKINEKKKKKKKVIIDQFKKKKRKSTAVVSNFTFCF